MKLPLGVNPAHVASKDATRYVLNGVQFAHGLAVATDGRSLVAAIATAEDDDADREAIVPTRAMLAGFKAGRGRSSVLPRLVINPKPENEAATVTITDKEFDQTTVKEIDGNFPTFEQVFEDHTKHTLKVGLNVKLLANIAKALGQDQIVMHFDPEGFKSSPHSLDNLYGLQIYITSNDENRGDTVGILMPLRASSDGLVGNRVLAEVAKIKAEKAAAKAETEAASNSQTTNPTE
jgi:DNA polymerase III sliding clamp (beta) subunit (PCNA family)